MSTYGTIKSIALFYEHRKMTRVYLLIDGLKLENGILKEVGSDVRDVLLAGLPFHFLGCLCDWKSNREQFLHLLKACGIFFFESVDSLNLYGS